MDGERGGSGEGLPADLADVRSVAGVGAHVDTHVAGLGEAGKNPILVFNFIFHLQFFK